MFVRAEALPSCPVFSEQLRATGRDGRVPARCCRSLCRTAQSVTKDWTLASHLHIHAGPSVAKGSDMHPCDPLCLSTGDSGVLSDLQFALDCFTGHFAGTRIGAPLSFTKNTRNFAGLVSLAFRPTT